MAQSPGVFSLENVEVKLREGDWATAAEWWRDQPTPNTGYFSGGSSGTSTITKTQFTTDTSNNIPATLPITRGAGSAMTSETVMYTAAGAPASPPVSSKIDKLVYATDTTSTLPGTIPSPDVGTYLNSKGLFGTNTHGYFAGGISWPSWSYQNRTWKIPFANESISTTSSMPSARINTVAVSSSTHGYVASGQTPGGAISTILKYQYSSDSYSSSFNGNNGFSGLKGGSATSSPSAGVFVGGNYNYTWKMPFSNDTANRLPGSNYPLSEVNNQGAAGNTSHGYHAGGGGGPAGFRSSIFKYNYATDGWSTPPAMPTVRNNPYGAGSKSMPLSVFAPFARSTDNAVEPPNVGYMYSGQGGSSNSSRSDTFKLDMDLDTWSTVPSMPSTNRYYGAQFGNLNYGYFVGGEMPSPSGFTRVDRMTYSTETLTNVPGWVNPYGGKGMTGVSNTVKGYAGLGYQPGPAYHGRVYKYDMPTETVDSNPITNGMPGVYQASASGNSTESYWGGGYSNPYSHVDSGNWTKVDKLTYSTDTFALQPGMNMYFPNPAANNKSAQGDGNATKGYHRKANNAQLVNYASGTVVPAPGAGGGESLSVMSNDVEVYMAGPSASETGKYNFASGTAQSIADMPNSKYQAYGISIRGRGVDFPKPPTATPTSGTGFTYNPALPNFAMNAGTSSNTRFVKLDYATDVMTTVPGQFIYVPNQYYNRVQGSAASSATAGYFAGGSGGPGQSSGTQWAWVDKYTYSSDTQSRMPDGTGIGTKNKPAAGNHEKAYWCAGGEYPQSSNSVSKMVFSTGAWSTQPSANLGANVRNLKVAGGPTEVWCLGGQYVNGNNQPSATPTYNATTIGKITYSNDTYSVVPSSVGANVPGNYARAMSNSTAMYTGGSGTPVDKFTFATTTNALFSSIAYSVPSAASASNETHGYWIGGKTPSGGSKCQKLIFATGTATVTPAPNPSSNVDNQQSSMATSARSDANAGTSGPTIL